MQEFIRAFDSGGGIRDIPIVQGSVPFLSVPFPGWPAGTGILLASLVANSSASRTNNIVTITATAHGITTGSTYVGFRFIIQAVQLCLLVYMMVFLVFQMPIP